MPPGLGEMGVKWPGRRQKMPPAQGARGQKGRGSRLAKPAVGDGAGAEPEVPRHPLPHPADDLAHGEGGGHGADPQALHLAQALPYPMVYFTREAGLRRVVDGLFAAAGGAPRIAYETEEDQVIAGLVAQGFGIAVVPQMELLHKLEVAVLKITSPDYRWEVFLTTCDGLFLAPAARDFRDFALRRSQEGR